MNNLFFNLSNDLQNLIYSYDPTYHNKFNNALKHLKKNTDYIRITLNTNNYISYTGNQWRLNQTYFSVIQYMLKDIKKKAKKAIKKKKRETILLKKCFNSLKKNKI